MPVQCLVWGINFLPHSLLAAHSHLLFFLSKTHTHTHTPIQAKGYRRAVIAEQTVARRRRGRADFAAGISEGFGVLVRESFSDALKGIPSKTFALQFPPFHRRMLSLFTTI